MSKIPSWYDAVVENESTNDLDFWFELSRDDFAGERATRREILQCAYTILADDGRYREMGINQMVHLRCLGWSFNPNATRHMSPDTLRDNACGDHSVFAFLAVKLKKSEEYLPCLACQLEFNYRRLHELRPKVSTNVRSTLSTVATIASTALDLPSHLPAALDAVCEALKPTREAENVPAPTSPSTEEENAGPESSTMGSASEVKSGLEKSGSQDVFEERTKVSGNESVTMSELYRLMQTEFKETKSQFKAMNTRLNGLDKNIAGLWKATSSNMEYTAKQEFLQMCVEELGGRILKPTGGKRFVGGPFLPRESKEAYNQLYAMLPKPSGTIDGEESRLYEQYGSVKEADPKEAEVDVVGKWVGGDDNDDDSKKFLSPTEKATGHQSRWFAAVVVAEVSASTDICAALANFYFKVDRLPKKITPSVKLVAKLLQLERSCAAVKSYYRRGERKPDVAIAALISPSFQNATQAATLLTHVLAIKPGAFPELRRLHAKSALWLLGP